MIELFLIDFHCHIKFAKKAGGLGVLPQKIFTFSDFYLSPPPRSLRPWLRFFEKICFVW